MWGVAQIKYANSNVFSRGVVALDTPHWVHLMTFPRGTDTDMALVSFPIDRLDQIEWIEVRLSSFANEPNGMQAARTMLEKYKHALYPAEEQTVDDASESNVPASNAQL